MQRDGGQRQQDLVLDQRPHVQQAVQLQRLVTVVIEVLIAPLFTRRNKSEARTAAHTHRDIFEATLALQHQ